MRRPSWGVIHANGSVDARGTCRGKQPAVRRRRVRLASGPAQGDDPTAIDRTVFGLGTGPAFGTGPSWQFQAAAIVAMVFLATLLSAKQSGSSLWLRTAEVAAIGLTAVVVAAHLWHTQLSATARGDATSLLGRRKTR